MPALPTVIGSAILFLMGTQNFLERFKAKTGAWGQMLLFWLMGSVATVVDLAVFSLGNYVLFTGLKNIPVHWWLLDYSVSNGGLCALLSFGISFAVSQTVNFFVQRKTTFSASGNVLLSGILYAAVVLGTYVLVLWLPTVISEPVCSVLGQTLGAVAVKLLCQFASFLVQFPLNKFLVMRDWSKKV